MRPARPAPPSPGSLASKADPFDLYQRAVQDPAFDVQFLDGAFRSIRGRTPLTLREDFCGTAAVACEWVASGRSRSALAVDLDPRPLEWGEAHNAVALSPDARRRLRLLEGDVLRVSAGGFDIVAAQNFSFYIFRERSLVRRYFRSCLRRLGRDGILLLDVMGGYETQQEKRIERRNRPGFVYCWEQKRFDPITHRARFAIHFRFRDGSQLDDAFTYDWRMWSIPELREILDEAGFQRSEVFWEGVDESTGGGDGNFRRCESGPAEAIWLAYVVGVK